MGFFKNVISGLKEAVKAGAEFNPTLETVEQDLEALHAQGHLDKTVYEAEQAYLAEHAEYAAKGTHTDAADSQRDVAALRHFMAALKAGQFEGEAKVQVDKLLEMYDKMEHILKNALKK